MIELMMHNEIEQPKEDNLLFSIFGQFGSCEIFDFQSSDFRRFTFG